FQQSDDSGIAAFIESVLRRFDMADRWAFHSRTATGSYWGMTEYQLHRLYGSAEAILNLHGGTVPTPEQSSSGRLIYIDTDPVAIQVNLDRGLPSALEILEPHRAFFTFGENYGNIGCNLPVSNRFQFKPTRQPVVLDFWTFPEFRSFDVFTTVGNWNQPYRVVEFNNQEYHWSKHLEFLKFIDLPSHTQQTIELALSRCDHEARELLLSHGWKFREPLTFSQDLDEYRRYILQSKAEFTVAKDQN